MHYASLSLSCCIIVTAHNAFKQKKNMNKELLYTFFQGKTTLDEEVRIREWMESSPENYRTFLEERKLFDAMILLADEKTPAVQT